MDNTPMRRSSARMLLAATLTGLLGGIVILAARLVTLARDDLIVRNARAFPGMAAFVLLAGGAVCAAVLRAAAQKKADAADAELIRTHNERTPASPPSHSRKDKGPWHSLKPRLPHEGHVFCLALRC